jgi:hypothetical protein
MKRIAVSALAASLSVVAGCSASTAPDAKTAIGVAEFTKSLNGRPGVFVLRSVEQQNSDVITTFDHTCKGVRYIYTVQDTIALSPNGSARRAFRFERTTNGVVDISNYFSFTGRWDRYDDGTSIVLSMSPDSVGARFDMYVRLKSTIAISSEGALGGSCAGEHTDGRGADFVYSRR